MSCLISKYTHTHYNTKTIHPERYCHLEKSNPTLRDPNLSIGTWSERCLQFLHIVDVKRQGSPGKKHYGWSLYLGSGLRVKDSLQTVHHGEGPELTQTL